MNIKTFKISIVLLTLVFICIRYYCHKLNTPLPLNKPCIVTVRYDLIFDDLPVTYVLSHKIVVISDKYGYDSLRGVFTINGESFTIARSLTFNHTKIFFSNSYEFQIIAIHKFPSDTVPESIENKYLTFMNQRPTRFLHLDRIDNQSILVSDPGGPSFICRHSI